MEKNHVRTIIIGSGPAGISCAYTLLTNNQECLIIDRKDFPREKLCGGGLTPKAHILIDRIFEGVKYDYHSSKTIDQFSCKKYICSYSLDIELRTVLREEFDHTLVKEYEKKGGQKITETVIKIEEHDTRIYLTTQSGKIFTCNFLIGADGANSIVRKYLQPNFDKGIVCLEKTVIDKSARNIEVYFDSKIKNGYLYLFPNKQGYVVGYGDKKSSIDRFHKLLEEYNLMSDKKTKGAYIPMSDKLDYPFRKSIMLIGDAGGYADSMTGEGIYFAVKSGENAALSIINNQDFKTLNQPVIDIIKKRKKMASLFFSPPFQKLFIYLCKKPKWHDYINQKVNKALSQ